MRELHLNAGDSVVFLSDGLVDAMNEQGELLGLEQVAEILTGCRENLLGRSWKRSFPEWRDFRKGKSSRMTGRRQSCAIRQVSGRKRKAQYKLTRFGCSGNYR